MPAETAAMRAKSTPVGSGGDEPAAASAKKKGGRATSTTPESDTSVARNSPPRQGSPSITKLAMEANSGESMTNTVLSPMGKRSTERNANAMPRYPKKLRRNSRIRMRLEPPKRGTSRSSALLQRIKSDAKASCVRPRKKMIWNEPENPSSTESSLIKSV